MAATLSPPSHGVFFPQEPPLPSIPSTDAARRHSQTGAYGDHQFGPTASRATGTHGLPALHHLTGAGGADVSLQLDELNFAGKLSNVEAQRIMSVLQDVQRKVILVGMLPDTMDRRVSSVFGQEVTMMLQEYRQHENKLIAMTAIKEAGDRIAQKEAWVAEYKEVALQLRSATRVIARTFGRNPALMNKLRYLKSTKLEPVAAFEQALQEIKMLVYERLRTTVEEEKAKQDQLSVIITKEQKTSAEVKTLQEELAKARAERSSEITKKNETIRKLKDQLREIRSQAEESTKKLESRSKQKEDSELKHFRDNEAALKVEIVQLRQNLNDSRNQQREEEFNLRKRKYKVETEVENWIHKYDQDMEEKQTELEDNTAIFLEERGQLDELQKRYGELQAEYNQIMREREIADQRKKAEEALVQRRNAAATKIQSVWRSLLCRRELAKIKQNKDKKGKKGDKGGKAGKKKKK